ncbi:phage major capsid protein [Bacillus cereus group sp. BcHK114]|uniref:phage major capsid protein n=1 Tax=Bacillus cereus group sp. BcHK114 TaxID=3018095 RepID=UPI0022DEAF04|nr:phage major capsid protein [Bacillus cereus group sp. BcHK114]MDA1958185.1 phage major capsid protein [Bacillus cereus group sp. BcHK114]
MKMELRFQGTKLSANEDGTMTVSGYVNKTDQLSNVLGTTKRFVEKIAKGAFAQAIKNAKEIDFLAEHNAKKILSSTRNGSLQLREDSQGLYMEATIVPTSYGTDTYELIKSGIFQNMSFGFRTIRDSWKALGNDLFERTITEMELFEVSVVKNPAYSQSTIAARGINLIEEVEIPNLAENKKEEEKRKMEIHSYKIENVEQRNFEVAQFKSYIENRNGTAQGAAIIPENVHNGIVQKLEELSPAFGQAMKFPSVSGSLKIPRETALADAGFVGEGADIVEIALNIGEVKLEQKRVGAAIKLSNQLIHDAAINIVDYVQILLARRTVAAIENSMFNGTGVDSFNGIVPNTGVQEKTFTLAGTDAQKVDNLLDAYNSIHPALLPGAAWYMSPAFFGVVSKMKDGNGHFYVQNGEVNGRPIRALFGTPIYVTKHLAGGSVGGEKPCVFGNITESYGIMIKKGMGLTAAMDTDSAMKGYRTFVFDAYMDGNVYNPDALAKVVLS